MAIITFFVGQDVVTIIVVAIIDSELALGILKKNKRFTKEGKFKPNSDVEQKYREHE